MPLTIFLYCKGILKGNRAGLTQENPVSRSRISACCLGILFPFYDCAQRPGPGNRAEDDQAVREMRIAPSKALAPGRLISRYTDDAAVFYADDPAKIGKNAIRKIWEGGFGSPGLEMHSRPLNIEASRSRDLAWANSGRSSDHEKRRAQACANGWKIAAESLLHSRKLNANYFDPVKGKICHTPAFTGLIHRCTWVP